MKASQISAKITYCEALAAEDSGATDDERRAAQRMAEKLGKLLNEAEPETYKWAPRWQGVKYEPGKFYSTTEIAAMIRAEIKVARAAAKAAAKAKPAGTEITVSDPIAQAPASIKIGARVPHYGSIDIWVKGIPADWYETGTDDWGHDREYPTAQLVELGVALRQLGLQ